jgi:hypothetical protein
MVMAYLDDGEAGPGARAHRHGAHPNGSVREGPGQRGVRAPNMGHGTWEGRGRDSALPCYGPFPRARSRVLVGWRAGGLAGWRTGGLWTVDCGLWTGGVEWLVHTARRDTRRRYEEWLGGLPGGLETQIACCPGPAALLPPAAKKGTVLRPPATTHQSVRLLATGYLLPALWRSAVGC